MYHSAKCPSSLHTEDALARRCIPGGTPYKNRCYLICVQLLSAPSSVQTSLPQLWELCVNVTLSSFHHTIVSSEPSGSSTVLERQKTAKESYRSVSRNLHFICLIGTYTAIAMVAKLIWSNFDNLRLHLLQPLLVSFWRVLEAFPLALTSSTSFFNSSCGSFSTHSSAGRRSVWGAESTVRPSEDLQFWTEDPKLPFLVQNIHYIHYAEQATKISLKLPESQRNSIPVFAFTGRPIFLKAFIIVTPASFRRYPVSAWVFCLFWSLSARKPTSTALCNVLVAESKGCHEHVVYGNLTLRVTNNGSFFNLSTSISMGCSKVSLKARSTFAACLMARLKMLSICRLWTLL